MKAVFLLLLIAFVVWGFWMSWEWLRNRNKNNNNSNNQPPKQ